MIRSKSVLLLREYPAEFNKLLNEVKRCNEEGMATFAPQRKIGNLDYLLYLYISADKGLEETIGLKHALGTYIKGIFQSKLNHKALLKGINLTSVNRIPANALTREEKKYIIDLYKRSNASIKRFCKFYGKRSYSCIYNTLKEAGLLKVNN